LSFQVFSQDVHFSHIHASPTFLNPAMTGMINNGMGRVIVNSKSQWNTVTNGYKTAAASADMKVYGNRGNVVGMGINLLADQAGDLDFTTVKAGLALSVLRSLDYRDRNVISLGAEVNHVSSRFDVSKMVGFEEEPLIALGISNKTSYFTYSIGLAWVHNFDKNRSFYNRAAGPNPISMYIGAWLRGYLETDLAGSDAAVVSLRADVNKTFFAVSYDFNISTWKRASRGAGGFELSVIHILDLDKHSRKIQDVHCPGL